MPRGRFAPGVPWALRAPQPDGSAPGPAPTQSNPHPVHRPGPPLVGAPWSRMRANGGAGGGSGGGSSAPPAPPARGASASSARRVFSVERDPQAPTRDRRAIDKLAMVVNSLIRKGLLVQTAVPDEFDLALGGLTAARDPGAADDGTVAGVRVGVIWTNTETLAAFVCVYAAAGAAVWKQVTS